MLQRKLQMINSQMTNVGGLLISDYELLKMVNGR